MASVVFPPRPAFCPSFPLPPSVRIAVSQRKSPVVWGLLAVAEKSSQTLETCQAMEKAGVTTMGKSSARASACKTRLPMLKQAAKKISSDGSQKCHLEVLD